MAWRSRTDLTESLEVVIRDRKASRSWGESSATRIRPR
jgi:hypothetical protein